MFVAGPAIFLKLDPAAVLALILGGRIITIFARGTFKYD